MIPLCGTAYNRSDAAVGYTFGIVLMMNRQSLHFLDMAAYYLIHVVSPANVHPTARFKFEPKEQAMIRAPYASLSIQLLKECDRFCFTFDEISRALGCILNDVHSTTLFPLLDSLARDVMQIPRTSLFWTDLTALQRVAEQSRTQRMPLLAELADKSLRESVIAFELDTGQVRQVVSTMLNFVRLFPEQGKVISTMSFARMHKTDKVNRCIQKLLHDYTIHVPKEAFLKISFREMTEFFTQLDAQLELAPAMFGPSTMSVSLNQTASHPGYVM